MVEMGVPLGQWSGSDATNALRESIERFNARTARQTAWLVGLTWVIAVLTLALFLLTGVLVWAAFREVRTDRSQAGARAWVLWSAKADAQGLTTEPYWPSWGYETRAECLQVANNVNGKFGKGEGNYGAQCLPDTVDPRGPKR
jgi:hypothetical protein